MILVALGIGALVLLMGAARAFSAADVRSLKALLGWVAALAGLSLVALLLITGRGAAALSFMVVLGPLAWNYWKNSRRARGRVAPPGSRMGRAEALLVLGLREGASEAEIRAAWVRLMRTAHPDNGGSDWLAARVNQARDVLLARKRA